MTTRTWTVRITLNNSPNVIVYDDVLNISLKDSLYCLELVGYRNKMYHTSTIVDIDESFNRSNITRVVSFYDDLRTRYINLLDVEPICNPEKPTEPSHLVWMLMELTSSTMTETKKHRWLGYIQGVMTSKGLITVQAERDLTRDIFNGK